MGENETTEAPGNYCTGCGRTCSLDHPECGIGIERAADSADSKSPDTRREEAAWDTPNAEPGLGEGGWDTSDAVASQKWPQGHFWDDSASGLSHPDGKRQRSGCKGHGPKAGAPQGPEHRRGHGPHGCRDHGYGHGPDSCGPHGRGRGHGGRGRHGGMGGCAGRGHQGPYADFPEGCPRPSAEDERLSRVFHHCARMAVHRERHQGGRAAALAVLGRHGAMTQAVLAEKLDIRAASASELLAKMEADGLVERSRDAEDGRALQVQLTPQGQEASQEAFRRRCGRDARLFEALSPQEKATLTELLDKLARSWH